MKTSIMPVQRAEAAEYASWFRALADASRVQIVSLLARCGEPMNVGEIVTRVAVGQSTVSAHLKVLAEVGFVLAEQRGTATYYRINEACVGCFPTAADIVMGRPVPPQPVSAQPVSAPTTATTRDRTIGRYSELARAAQQGSQITDWGPDGPDAPDAGQFGAAAYAEPAGVPEEALRASLGCGNPVAVADLQPGERVLDLGSGGGLDVLLSARRVGPSGTVYGVDGSADMLALARANADRAGARNARFLLGHIEDIPLPAGHVDVVISNCVVNLSADKPRVVAEAFRVLRPGGRLGISDIIAGADLDSRERMAAENIVGCTNGTLTQQEYEDQLSSAGFASIRITITSDVGGGLHSAIIQAVRPLLP
jgi:arsenite methyltransferase